MAASLCCCQLNVPGKSIASNSQISSCQEETAPRIVSFENKTPAPAPAVSLRTETIVAKRSGDDLCDRSFGWTAKVTSGLAAMTLIAAAPTTVLAAELDFSSPSAIIQAIPGDHSLSIAIPIPDNGTWLFAESGFLAPPPRGSVGGGRAVVTRNPLTGGCPSWNPVNFEMVVPDGVRPKTFPRQGSQWSALYIIEDETQTIYSEVVETSDPVVRYSSILDALLRMSDTTLTCFRL